MGQRRYEVGLLPQALSSQPKCASSRQLANHSQDDWSHGTTRVLDQEPGGPDANLTAAWQATAHLELVYLSREVAMSSPNRTLARVESILAEP